VPVAHPAPYFPTAWAQASDQEHVPGQLLFQSSAPAEERYELNLRGTAHCNFEDEALFFEPFLKLLGVLGPLDGQQRLEITRGYVQAFFDTYLKHAPSSLLRGPSPNYPEVHFVSPEQWSWRKAGTLPVDGVSVSKPEKCTTSKGSSCDICFLKRAGRSV